METAIKVLITLVIMSAILADIVLTQGVFIIVLLLFAVAVMVVLFIFFFVSMVYDIVSTWRSRR